MSIDWNAAYLEERTPWDKGSPAPPLIEFLERTPMQGRVFVPGCGLGHDVRAIAGKGGKVTGFDISPKALELAKSLPSVGEEDYREGDLFELSDDLIGAFDWVFEHTCLSALSPNMRPGYIEALHSALRPGGQMLAIYFLNPWDEGETPEPPPYGIEISEIDEMIEGWFRTDEEWRPKQSYPERENRELVRWMTRL